MQDEASYLENSKMMTSLELTDEQMKIQNAILAFVSNPGSKPYITVGGYAGTGKTTVVAETRKLLQVDAVAFCAFTGKAGYVLKQKLTAAGIAQAADYVGTVHGLIYERVESEEWYGRRRKLIFRRRRTIPYNLIILDEASMMNEQLFTDLLSFGIPIVAVGDHGQLPPVQGRFNLMESPEYRLETIHRQVADHPILKIASMARRYGVIPVGAHGDGVTKVLGSSCLKGMDLASWLVLCGKNVTRVKMNKAIRGKTDGMPIAGDKVICLRNNRSEGIFNGMIGVLAEPLRPPTDEDDYEDPDALMGVVDFDLFRWSGAIHMPQFNEERTTSAYDPSMGALFDFANCITVHKSQGSEADSVVVIEEKFGPPDPFLYARWLYTAVTRARKNLLIIG